MCSEGLTSTCSKWGYCDSCDKNIYYGDMCWIEPGFEISEAMTFCVACWDKSEILGSPHNKTRNITVKGYYFPMAIRADLFKITFMYSKL